MEVLRVPDSTTRWRSSPGTESVDATTAVAILALARAAGRRERGAPPSAEEFIYWLVVERGRAPATIARVPP